MSLDVSDLPGRHETLASSVSSSPPSGSSREPASELRPEGVFELKFVISEDQAAEITAWARKNLQADPHCEKELGDGYHVNSLYLDTPQFDIYRRGELYCRQKYRLRRYGAEPTVWLETKFKVDGRVRKRRLPVADPELLARLRHEADATWDGQWFWQEQQRLQLRPVCQVTYERSAWIGTLSTEPVRLTLDRDLRAAAVRDWEVPGHPLLGPSLLRTRRIVEFKFRDTLPTPFKCLIQDLALQSLTFSKYRTCAEASLPTSWLAGDA